MSAADITAALEAAHRAQPRRPQRIPWQPNSPSHGWMEPQLTQADYEADELDADALDDAQIAEDIDEIRRSEAEREADRMAGREEFADLPTPPSGF